MTLSVKQDGENTGSRPSTEIVGREAEQRQLSYRLQQFSLSREGGAIVLKGSAGIGKSTLVNFLREEAQRQELALVQASADSNEATTPYFIWRSVLNQLAPKAAGQQKQAMQRWLRSTLDSNPGLQDALPLLNGIGHWDFPVDDSLRLLTDEGRRSRLIELLLQILAHVAQRRPMVILIDDAHWLDSASWALLKRFFDTQPPALLIVARRLFDGDPPRELQDIEARKNTLSLRLDTLSAAQGLQVVRNCLGVDTLPEWVARLVNHHGAGHPFYCEEVAYMLRDLEALNRDSAASASWISEAEAMRRIGEPASIEEIVQLRLGRLSTSQQDILSLAALIGRAAPADALRSILGTDLEGAVLNADLAQLVQLNFLRAKADADQPQYLFHHHITQAAADQLQRERDRSDWHAGIAQWYEAHFGHCLPLYYAKLIHHWREAGNRARSLEYLEKAAEHASRSGAYAEAIRYYEQLIAEHGHQESSTSALTRASWEVHIAEAQQSIGDPWSSLERLQRGVSLLGYQHPGTGLLFLNLLRQITIQWWRRRTPARIEDGDNRRNLLASQAFERIGEVYFYRNDAPRVLLAALYQVNVASLAGPSPELVRAAATMRLICTGVGAHRQAENYARRAQELETQIRFEPGAPGAMAFRRLATGIVLTTRGALAEAVRELEKALLLCQEHGELRSCTDVLAILEYADSLRGRFHRVDAHLREHEIIARKIAGPGQTLTWHQVWVLLARAQNNCLLGNVELAEAELDLAENANPAHKQNPLYSQWYPSLRSLCLMLRGEYAEAARAISSVLPQLHPSATISFHLLECHAAASEIELQCWEHTGDQRDRGLLRRGLSTLRRFARHYPAAHSRCLTAQGRYLCLAGHENSGRKLLRQALDLAVERDMRYDEGLASLALARSYPGGSEERREHAQSAHQVFARMNSQVNARLAIQLSIS